MTPDESANEVVVAPPSSPQPAAEPVATPKPEVSVAPVESIADSAASPNSVASPPSIAAESVSASPATSTETSESTSDISASASPKAAPPVPEVKVHYDLGRIAQDLQIRKLQVEAVVHLLDEGNTIPFITRYRKERTGGLNEEVLRQIQKRVQQQRNLTDRKQTILRNLTIQGKLTEELKNAVLYCEQPKRLEDLYLPFKPKKKSLAAAAREKGLGELAQSIWNREPVAANLGELLPTMVSPEKGLNTIEDILAGVGHILAEQMAELPEVRDLGRRFLWDTARLVVAKNENVAEGQGQEFKDYFNYVESVRQIPPHRVLAINRGERENIIKCKLDAPFDRLFGYLLELLPLAEHPHAELLKRYAQDAMARLLVPSIEREIRRDLTDRAEEHAVAVFARNLRRLLLQPPVRGKRVLAIDPAYRTGCKLAVLDEYSAVLDTSTIYPFATTSSPKWEKKKKKDEKKVEAPAATAEPSTPADGPAKPEAVSAASTSSATQPDGQADHPANSETAATTQPSDTQDVSSTTTVNAAPETATPAEPAPDKKAEAKAKLIEFAKQHKIDLIALGNGTASRETEEIVAAAIAEALPGVSYVVVNEAGASHYSTSPTAREEFPNLDATARGTVSIGRRLQDALSELVKIDPQNLGVGLYQHDIAEKKLKESLESVVESAVNYVGVDLNTASAALLRYVAGLNQLRAHAIVDRRNSKGPFKTREQLQEVPGIGDITYTQAAGFLRIPNSENPFDNTAIHPETYVAANKLLEKVNKTPGQLSDGAALIELRAKLTELPAEPTAQELGIGLPTYHDLVEALTRPGRDPREELPPPIFKQGILQIEDLKPGLELKGTVQNVVDFGAFVDVGLKDSGLVHISQLANKFIKSPYDIVSVGDIVTVWVMTVDMDRRRVSLTMIAPGTERRLPERRPQAGPPFQRGHRSDRQERGPRPEGQQQERGLAPERPVGQERADGPRRFEPRREGQDRGGRFGGPPRGPGGTHAGRFGGGRRPFPPRHGQPLVEGTTQGSAATPPPPRPAPKPRRERPKPKLTEAAMSGKAPLRTFGELKALFEAKQPKEETPIPTQAVVQPPAAPADHPPAPPAVPEATSGGSEG